RPGAAAALDAAVEAAVLRRRPILFYYFSPTWLMGKLGGELVMLEEPPYDAATWQALNESERPEKATAYPMVAVHVGVNADFAQAAPELARFLTEYGTTAALVSAALADMQETGADA